MRKLLTVITLCFISVMSFAVEVQLWEKWQTSLDPAYDAVIAGFEKANPTIKIKRVHYETEDLRYNFQNAALAGNPPALVVGPADTVGVYATMGIIKPINEVKSLPKTVITSLVPQGVAQLKIDGELYGVPEQIGNHLTLIYNKKFVKKVPDTFEEMFKTNYGTQYKLVYNLNEPFWSIGFLGAYGGWVLDAKNNPTLNTPAMVKALQFMNDLKFKYKAVPAEADYPTADTLFKDGKAAFIINGDWSYKDYEKVLGANLGLARVPKLPGGDYYTPSTAVQGIFVAEGLSANVEAAAAKFIEYLTRKDIQLIIAQKNNTLPVNIAAANDPSLKKDPMVAASIAQMMEGKPMPVVPEMRAIWDAIRPSQEEVMANKTTAAAAAAKMQATAVQKIKEMNQ